MKQYRYAIFRTQWGWFGLLGSERGIVRTYLPDAQKEAVQSRILSDFPGSKQTKTAFSALKKSIEDYYQGSPVDFGNVEVCLADSSEFQQRVLTTLRTISYGEIVSYSQLAKLAGSSKAVRAIGMVMAQNPLPLIIPCHRVIKADGSIGQFSAAGGTDTKKKMLNLEKGRSV